MTSEFLLYDLAAAMSKDQPEFESPYVQIDYSVLPVTGEGAVLG